ncbi:MAG: hypothetical protein IJS78_07160 [Clostridia bacterium]|nr:hypothetical protein [Clostridia bacterium]
MKIKRSFLWFLLLEKRLFKKAGYIVLLVAVPLVALVMSLVATRSDGAFKVALYCADRGDPISSAMYEKLVSDNDLVGFREAASREDARELVETGIADTAWIIEGGVKEKLKEYVSGKDPSGPIFTVYVREQTPVGSLAREKLSSVVSRDLMKEAMKEAIRNDFEYLGIPDEKTLDRYYDEAVGKEDILQFAYADSDAPAGDADVNYLLLPVRGILSVMTVLCGLATALYYRRDTADRVVTPTRGALSFVNEAGYILTGTLPAAAVSGISLAVAGVTADPFREIVSLLVFSVTSSLFCTLIMKLTFSEKVLAVLTPEIVIALVAISPVFFDLSMLKPLQMTTPTYYYLMGIHSSSHLALAAAYAACLAALCAAVGALIRLPERIGKRA